MGMGIVNENHINQVVKPGSFDLISTLHATVRLGSSVDYLLDVRSMAPLSLQSSPN